MELELLIGTTSVLVIILLLVISLRKRKKRRNYNDLLTTFVIEAENANNELLHLLSSPFYINHHKTFSYTQKYQLLFNNIPKQQFEKLAEEGNNKEIIKLFLSNFKNLNGIISDRNQNFVQKELLQNQAFFDNIEGKSLDDQQRKAIVVDEDNTIVVAGAGSGKTTTIAGKVKYLIERYNVKPEEILLISFTRKAADEMRNRIKEKMKIDISVKTFHKLGLDIISEAKNEKPSIFDLSKKQTLELFASFIEHAREDSETFSKLIHFSVYWLKPYKEEKDFDTEGERTNYLVDQKYEGLKLTGLETFSYKLVKENYGLKLVRKKVAGRPVTYREKLKSQEEVLIANFLFTNNIEYSYEERYEYKTSSKTFEQYKPDFYLPDYGIYIEHFAIDRQGNVPEWFRGDDHKSPKEKYNAGIDWKREEHRRNKTTLIETYSWEKRENVLLTNLESKLRKHGVSLKPKSNEEIWQYLQENTPAEIDNLTTLVHTFLVLLKSNNLTVPQLKSMAQQDDDKRAMLFLELFTPIYDSYNRYLLESEEIDFSDMINNATKEINNASIHSPYKYIIIDEFQDISLSRYQLVKTLLDKNPETKLFCVGDDWQSIYRFAGSDIGIFTDFEDYFKSSSLEGFERKTNKSYIEKTYRFDNKLIELSSNFVLKNPNQIRKTLTSQIQTDKKPFTVLDYNYNYSIVNPLHDALDSIAKISNGKPVSVKLLGRYSHEINEIRKNSKLIFRHNQDTKETKILHPQYQNLLIDFHTVHSAKGLEADFIIILNGDGGRYGFPTEISDDPLLNFLLSKSDQFPNGEERRVFYVALTRAKRHVYILSNTENRSKFVDEIEIDENVNDNKKCEWCDNGILLERKGRYGYFYACSSSHYCNYTRKIEPSDFIEKADNLKYEKNYSQAIDYYSKAIELDNKDYLTFYKKGRCLEENGEKKKALQEYSKAINLNGNHFDSFYWRGSANYDLNNFQEALNDWKNALRINPENISTHYWIAKSEFNLSQYLNALESIDKYINLKPDDREALVLRGECYAKTKQYKYAYNDWQKAQSLGHNNIEYYLRRYDIDETSKIFLPK